MSDGQAVSRCALIVGGRFHDMDYARRELLAGLARDDRIRARVFEDYERLDVLDEIDFLVTYTCDVVPSPQAQAALSRFVKCGGRWLALHGTNSILRFLENGKVDCPKLAPEFMETLGSTFVAHPAIEPYLVEVARPQDPLVKGIEPFTVTDELYLLEQHAPLDVLLYTTFEGRADGFVQSEWPRAQHPVLYRRKLGQGEVVYLTLGHCRGHYDMQPLMPRWPRIDLGSWTVPEFRLLVERGIAWAAGLEKSTQP